MLSQQVDQCAQWSNKMNKTVLPALVVVAMLLSSCGPRPNAATQEKIQQTFNSHIAVFRQGMLQGRLRVGKGNTSEYFAMNEFNFTLSDKQDAVAFRFYSPSFGRCTGTFDGQYVFFIIHKDYRHWNEH